MTIVMGPIGRGRIWRDVRSVVNGSAAFLSDALAISSEMSGGYLFIISDSLNISSDTRAKQSFLAALLESLEAGDATTIGKAIAQTVLEVLLTTDARATLLQMHGVVVESLEVQDGTPIFMDGSIVGYVVNVTTGAPSVYEGYPFNSFAKIGERYFGAGDGGVFELVGDTDAGAQIASVVALAPSNLGIGHRKRVDEVLVSGRLGGSMVVSVYVDNTKWDYILTPTATEGISRAQPGMGLRMNYWTLELANLAGADFDIDGVSIAPVELDRRIDK